MSRFACTYCSRTFPARVRRPPDCPTQDCCDIQEVPEPEELDPISELLGQDHASLASAPKPVSAPAARPVLPVAPPVATAPVPLAPVAAASLTVSSLIGGFVITGAEPAQDGDDRYFAGAHKLSGDRVRIRHYRAIGPQQPGMRSELRKLIELHGNAAFLRILHLEPADGFSYEVLEGAHGVSLRDFAAGQPTAADDVRAIVGQLARLIAELHTPKFQRWIVHRGLTLDTVFLRGAADGSATVEIGGWESALVVTANSELTFSIPLPDLRTCPPEMAGRTTFSCDEQAKAWDWWSLGRMAQELALGRPVFDLLPTGGVEAEHLRQLIMLDEDTTRYSPKGVRYRPGLVEISSGRVDPSSTRLLRGLLASNPRARWGAAAVEGWLQGKAPEDPYDLAAVEPVFAWDGKAFSVSEAAKYLLTQAAWPDAISNFVESANSKRLSYQILHVYKARRYIEAFDSATKLLADPALTLCARSFREGLATGLFLSSVAEYRDTLIVAGRHLDRDWLVARLNEASTPEANEVIAREMNALFDPSVVRRIETQCAGTGRMLREVQALYQDARRPLERNREILDLRNARDVVVLLKLVLADPAWLAAEAGTTRQQFHDAGVSPWREIWAQPGPLDPAAQVLVLIARMDVVKARLRTPEQWANEQIDALRAEAARHYNFLVHANAYRVMTWGFPTFGGPLVFALCAAASGAALLHGLGWPLAGPGWVAPVLIAVALRALGWYFAGAYLGRALATRIPLPFLSLSSYLLGRVERLMPVVNGERQDAADALALVDQANDEIRRLTPPGQPARVFDTHPPALLSAVAVAHWVVIAVGVVLAVKA